MTIAKKKLVVESTWTRTRLVRVFNFFNVALEKKFGGMNFLIEKIECVRAPMISNPL